MKKLLSVLLVLVMVFSLAACGSGDNGGNTGTGEGGSGDNSGNTGTGEGGSSDNSGNTDTGGSDGTGNPLPPEGSNAAA